MIDQWIDVDFTTQVPEGRMTGCSTRFSAPGDGTFSEFSHVIKDTIPRSEWKERIAEHVPLAPLVKKIKDQNGEGSCAANAAATCLEVMWNWQLGDEAFIEMSAMSLYKRTGSGPNSGSNIDSNLIALRDDGILPVNNTRNKELFAHTFPPIGWRNRLPSGWTDTAKDFRVLEWLDIRNFDDFITALLMNIPVCYGRSGHAIAGIDPVWHNGQAMVKYANSWHESWGDKGFGYDSERAIGRYIDYYGAWGPLTVLVPSWATDDPDEWEIN